MAQRAFQIIEDLLVRQYGFSRGFANRAWQQFATEYGDAATEDQFRLWVQDTDEFKQRFPAIEQRRAKGLAPISPYDYVELERTYQEIMRASGLPKGFYDNPRDFTELIAKNVSPAEVQSRVKDGYERIANAPASVRSTFAKWFGKNGDSMLAAYFLDPDKAAPMLEEQARRAEVGGALREQDMDIDMGRARKLAAAGYDYGQSLRLGAEVRSQDALFDETVGETDSGAQDFMAEREGIDAMSGLDPDAARKLRERRQSREAKFSGGGSVGETSEGTAFGASD